MSSFCLGCGNSLSVGERFCPVCGRDAEAGTSAPRIDPEVAFGLPPQTSAKAIFSLICGVLFLILPLSIVGVIFGCLALSEIRKNPGRFKGRGLAIAGIAFSFIGVALTVFVIGLGIYGIGKASREMNQRQTAIAASSRKKSVISTLRTVNTAEIAYAQGHPETGYTCSMSELPSAWITDKDLSGSGLSGYKFELRNCSASKPGGRVTRYQLFAYASDPQKQPAMTYCSDESDVIRASRGRSPQDCLKTGRQLSDKEISGSPTVGQAVQK